MIIDKTESIDPKNVFTDEKLDCYEFTTKDGVMYIKPSEIMMALREQVQNETSDPLTPPEEDLEGWGIINATDENGVSRPLLLMRMLPAANNPIPYYKVMDDDTAMSRILLSQVYKLTPLRIKWIRFISKIKRIYEIIKD